MKSYSYSNAHEAYYEILESVLTNGNPVSSRGGDTLEVEDFVFSIADVTKLTPQRKGFSPLLGLMEGAQLVSSYARPALMDSVWPKLKSYTDHFGDYGDRMLEANQLEKIFDLLKTDKDTRRAVTSLWLPRKDASGGHLDHPCTLSISFRIRNDKLNMTVVMRSNDVFRGLSSDIIQFQLLQVTFAEALGYKSGTYTHLAQSMHMYTSDAKAVASILSNRHTKPAIHPRVTTLKPLSEAGWSYDQIQKEAKECLSATGNPATTIGQQIRSELDLRQRQQSAE